LVLSQVLNLESPFDARAEEALEVVLPSAAPMTAVGSSTSLDISEAVGLWTSDVSLDE
jgi:hypothetical protein